MAAGSEYRSGVAAPRTGHARLGASSGRPGMAGRSWLPDLVGAAAALSVVVVVALWVHGQGIQDLFGDSASALTSVGRLTGLVGTDLLLVQVMLMARAPFVERAFGQDRLARWHRLVGFTSFDLVLAHIVFITLGYAGSGRTGLLREAWELITTYPGMLLATAATAALVMVVVTSLKAARRALRYESWHLLHLYAYLGIGLAVPHELWTGTIFLGAPAATAYWWTLYGIAAGSILLFRLGLPIWRSARHQLVVAGVAHEAPGVISVYLRGRRLDLLPARAGQFFNWRFLAGPGWTRAHPYSLSAAPRPDMLRITVKEQGDDTSKARWLRPGTRVLIEGPYGKLTHEVRSTGRVTMMASGIGITPLRALLEELPYRRGEATLIYRARTPRDFAFRAELDALSTQRGVRVHYLPGPRTGDGSWAPAGWGRDDKLLRKLVPSIAHQDVYICGPEQWMNAAADAARRNGVPDEHLHVEFFSW